MAEAISEVSTSREDSDNAAPPFDVAGFIVAGQRMPIVPEVDAPESDALPDDVMRGVNWGAEDGIASAFTRRFGQDWRYCAQWSKWLVWTGQRWNEDQVLYIHHLSRGICRAASEKADSPRLKAKLASASTISAVERMVRAEPTHAASVDEWDSDIWLLNTPGGVVDLRTVCAIDAYHLPRNRLWCGQKWVFFGSCGSCLFHLVPTIPSVNEITNFRLRNLGSFLEPN